MEREQKIEYVKSLLWDYNISPEECLEVLEGSRKKAGHYDAEMLFRKMIESWRWFTVLKILPKERIQELLTEKVLVSLRDQKLTEHYRFVKRELQRELQLTG